MKNSAIICWSRMQAEAGQGLDRIVARKEAERRAGNGTFFWGVGHPPAAAIGQLARSQTPIPVYFSIMKSKPKAHDVAPDRVLAWRRYVDMNGQVRDLPELTVVTSRASSRDFHFALVCFSARPLSLGDYGNFDHRAYRNVSAVGGPVGASQVTALLNKVGDEHEGQYRINLSAQLIGSYWVRLVDSVDASASDLSLLDKIDFSEDDLRFVAASIRRTQPNANAQRPRSAKQRELFTV